MQRVVALGAAVLVVGLVGYTLGIGTAYPGRAFSVTAVMLGMLLVALLMVWGFRGRGYA